MNPTNNKNKGKVYFRILYFISHLLPNVMLSGAAGPRREQRQVK